MLGGLLVGRILPLGGGFWTVRCLAASGFLQLVEELGCGCGYEKRVSGKSPETLTVELRGLPPYVGIPPFLRRFATSGTSSGTLRGFFLDRSS